MSTDIFIGNLPFSATEDELEELCKPHGEVTRVKIITDRETGRSRGFAFVSFASTEEAKKAADNMTTVSLDGRDLRVNLAEPKKPSHSNRG